MSRCFLFLCARFPPPSTIRFRNKGLQNTAMPEAIVFYMVSGLDDRDILARTAATPDSLLASVRREIPQKLATQLQFPGAMERR
jgi:hypothetical protein